MSDTETNCRAGILLINLGTPDSPSRRDVKRYLREFLSDPRVVEMPRILWWPILHGAILNIRPARSARAYQKIWMDDGSPLLFYTLRQADALQEKLGKDITVVPAMRYGNPSITQGLEQLRDRGCQHILVFPLYPQYSATTTASAFDAVVTELKHWRLLPELRLLNQYFDNPGYIQALANSIRGFQEQHGQPGKLILSYHGLPQRYADAGDPYPYQCEATTHALVSALNLDEDQWRHCYQSRMGREPWLQPATADTLRELAKSGCRHVQVICPGFSSDCLETLEEIAMENREIFLEAGGEQYDYIPCLNDSDEHIDMLAGLAMRYLGGWVDE
ncbi:ferrochelatase [Thiolapillus sp.]